MHGTTSGLSKPHDLLLRPSNNGARCIGRTRSPLLMLQEDHSGRYFGALSYCLSPAGSSLKEIGSTYFIPSRCSNIFNILTNSFRFVKGFSGSF